MAGRLKFSKNIFEKIKIRLASVKTSNILFILIGAVFLSAIGYFIYQYWGNISLAIPGLINHEDYNEITDRKNDLISSNSEILSQNSSYESDLSALSTDDYEERMKIYEKLVSNLQEVVENIGKMIDINQEIQNMNIPVYIGRYVELSDELDKLRLQAIQKSLFITEARIDLNEFNEERESFDVCLNNVAWDGSDSAIQEDILECLSVLSTIDESVIHLEDSYDVDLTDLKDYLNILEEQWISSANYYSALSSNDYNLANKYDAVFAEKRREIEELDLETVLGSFLKLVINPAIEEFSDINDQVESKQEEVDIWYEENIEK